MHPVIWLTVLLWIFAGGILASGYNILVMMPFSSKSHVFAFQPVAEELARRGHNVTVASSSKHPAGVSPPGLEYVQLQLTSSVMQKYGFNYFEGDFSNTTFRRKFIYMLHKLAEETYNEPLVQDVIRSPRDVKTGRPKYDVLILDAIFNDFVLPLAHHMGVPSIYFSPAPLIARVAVAMDVPYPLSYLSMTMDYLPTQSLSFFERLNNLYGGVVFYGFYWWLFERHYNDVVAKHLPDSPPISTLERNVSFILQSLKIPLVRSSPLMSYYVAVGSVHCKPAQKLPQDLEDFMQSSGDAGVIYFSLGSFTHGEFMPPAMKHKFLEVFAQLPQKVLWKYESDIDNLPENVKLVKWAPQQDILGHSKLRLFITHGGSLSTQESACHGCPLLTIPLGADQNENAGNVVMAGMAEHLDWTSFTTQELLDKIKLLITDKRYKESALKTSSIILDNPMDPKALAAYWIEYVVRHNGAHHLKSAAGHLNLFQYYMVDVIGFTLLCFLLVLVAFVYIIKAFLGLCRKFSKMVFIKKGKQE